MKDIDSYIDMSECVIEFDEKSDYSVEDLALDLFIKYVNNNSQFIIERI